MYAEGLLYYKDPVIFEVARRVFRIPEKQFHGAAVRGRVRWVFPRGVY